MKFREFLPILKTRIPFRSQNKSRNKKNCGQIAFSPPVFHLLLITIASVIFFNSVFNINGILYNGECRVIVEAIRGRLDLLLFLRSFFFGFFVIEKEQMMRI